MTANATACDAGSRRACSRNADGVFGRPSGAKRQSEPAYHAGRREAPIRSCRGDAFAAGRALEQFSDDAAVGGVGEALFLAVVEVGQRAVVQAEQVQ